MTHIEQFQKEFERESISMRKMLSIVPGDRFDWQPHPKSMTLRQLATHIAEIPLWFGMVLTTTELDFAVNGYKPKELKDTAELVAYLEANISQAKKDLAAGKEDSLDELWTLRSGDQVFSSDPKRDAIRMSFNQIIHHRAQLGVFLRLLNIPIPGTYGPSADDMSF